jgi:hypothetical protein
VRRPFKSQEGVALPVAMAMMLVISLIVVAFFTTALQVNETSVKDRSTKRALAAAEAGLQMAMYRLNQIGTNQPTQCLTTTPTTTTWVALLPSGQCPVSTDEDVGNGASYTYYVTPEIINLAPAQQSCILLPGQTPADTDRCITVIGHSDGVQPDGVQRRVQVRVNTGAVSYKSVGLMSNSLIYAGTSAKITSEVAANGIVHFGNSAKTFSDPSADIDGSVLHAPDSTYQISGSSQVIAGGRQSVPTPYEFPPIEDFDTVKMTATNIVSGLSRPQMSYTASTKTLRVTGAGASLPAGTYYFCRFSMASSAKLTFSPTQPTKIYIDSPSRAGSLCGNPPVSNPSPNYPVGTFWMENSNEFNKGGNEALVEVFVEGTSRNGTRSRPSFCTPSGDSPHTDKCESDVILANSAWFEGMIYAPKTTVELNNSGTMLGAIAADKIRFNNSVEFTLTDAVKDSATAGGIDRSNWVECRPQPITAGDPESGC